jgi:hypothetical protein
MEEDMKIEATRLRESWCIRPVGCLGTCGWINGKAWTARFVKQLPAGMPIAKD